MNITPKDGPAIQSPPAATAQSSARERAIAKLMETPVQNATQVTPEELSIVKPPATAAQTDTNSSQTSEEPAVTPKAPKEDPLNNQYAQLARRERALRAKVQTQEAALKAKEAAIAEREAAIKAKEVEYTSNYISKNRIKSDPLAVLAEEGVSYDELTKAILNPQMQQDPRIIAEIEKLKADVQAAKDYQAKAQEEYKAQQKQAYDQAVAQIRNEAKQLVLSDPSFELIKETKSVGDVVDLIERTYHKDGILMSVEEAAREVEEYLAEEGVKLAQYNKIRAKLQALQKPAPQQQNQEAPKQPQQPGMKTLTNAVNASKPMTARERAIAAFHNKLK